MSRALTRLGACLVMHDFRQRHTITANRHRGKSLLSTDENVN